jgi:AbrB family looped-hinge helix DNA binding protein
MEDGSLARVLRRLQGGQVCLPEKFRRRLGIDEGAILQLTLKEDKIEIVPVDPETIAEMGWTRELYAMLKLVDQKDASNQGAKIDAMIDEALDGTWPEDCD